jgi:hypothetical protein
MWGEFSTSLDTLAEIVRHGKQMPWDGQLSFESALQQGTREVFTPQTSSAELDKGRHFEEPGLIDRTTTGLRRAQPGAVGC